MEITVPLVVTVPEDAAIDDLEGIVLDAGRQAMCAALAGIVSAIDALPTTCPSCGSAALQRDGSSPRIVTTRFGRVEFSVRRCHCRSCGGRSRPSATLLAPLGTANLTPGLRQLCALAGSSWPFATAARVIRELSGAAVSAEGVRQVTRVAGTVTAVRQQAAAQALLAPSAEQVRAERRASYERTRHGSRPVAEAASPAMLQVGLDGGWVASRDQAGGMEGKVAVLATGQRDLGAGRQRLTPRQYVATFGPAREVGELAYAAAEALGGNRATTQVVLGDGAAWIKQQTALHFPAAVTILDWPHLWRVMRRAIRAVHPGRVGRGARRSLAQTLGDHLWHGQVAEARTRLAALRVTEEPPEALDDAIRYLDTQRDWLGDYADWRNAGYPVGSGLIERAVALVINRRMKRQGMRWRRDSATAIVALRVEQLNRDWDDTDDVPLTA